MASLATAQSGDPGWLEDLRFLAEELPRRHVNAFAQLSPQAWQERVGKLAQAIHRLPAITIQAELMMLVASLGDSHTTLQPASLIQAGVPLRLAGWPDGIRVFGIANSHQELLGSRLVAIDGRDLATIETSLARVFAADNEGARQLRLTTLLTRPVLLQALGLAKVGEPVRYEFVTGNGERRELPLLAGELSGDVAFDRPAKTCVTDQRGRLWHHFEFLEQEGIAYVQYNRCASDATHDLSAFTAKVKEATTRVTPRVWIFDLQYNGGGNSALGDRMFATLIGRGARVFGIIGPQTFSSGLLNAMTLKNKYGATLVGRPTGGRPTHFGEVRTFTLPHSRLVVQYSTKRFVHGDPKAESLAPDLRVARSHEDYLAGRDPILEAIRELSRK